MIGCRWNKISRCLFLNSHMSHSRSSCNHHLKHQIGENRWSYCPPLSNHHLFMVGCCYEISSVLFSSSFEYQEPEFVYTCAWLCLYHFVFVSQFKSILTPRVNCPFGFDFNFFTSVLRFGAQFWWLQCRGLLEQLCSTPEVWRTRPKWSNGWGGGGGEVLSPCDQTVSRGWEAPVVMVIREEGIENIVLRTSSFRFLINIGWILSHIDLN